MDSVDVPLAEIRALGGSWTCHVCGDERPDALIGVFQAERELAGMTVQCNIRYCRDRADCVADAVYVTFGDERFRFFVVDEMP